MIMKLHEEIYEGIKNRKLFAVVQMHLRELIELMTLDSTNTLSRYEQIINDKFLSSCKEPETLYLYLAFKLSLSETSKENGVFAYQDRMLTKLYESKRIPEFLRTSYPLIELIADKQKRTEFLKNIAEQDRHIYPELEEAFRIRDTLEEISKRDEESEEDLRKKILLYALKHPFRTRSFIKNLEKRKPSLELLFRYLH